LFDQTSRLFVELTMMEILPFLRVHSISRCRACGLALRGAEPCPRHGDLHPAKAPQMRARSVTVAVAGDTARALVLGSALGRRA
jgi:hypothetical protein